VCSYEEARTTRCYKHQRWACAHLCSREAEASARARVLTSAPDDARRFGGLARLPSSPCS
jgi:hypothetical protein